MTIVESLGWVGGALAGLALLRYLFHRRLHRPFSRCLDCNTPLRPASPAQLRHVPRSTLAIDPTAWYCPTYDKVLWRGSHVRRMRHTLENFARGDWVVAGH